MGTAAVQIDEEALVKEAIARVELPPGVRLRRIDLDYIDSTGDRAVQVIFAASRKIPLTRKRVVELARFHRAVAAAISSLGLPKWPYVNFAETR